MKVKAFRLKQKKPNEDYPTGVCAASRCYQRTEVIDATSGESMPLCDRHWTQLCETAS